MRALRLHLRRRAARRAVRRLDAIGWRPVPDDLVRAINRGMR